MTYNPHFKQSMFLAFSLLFCLSLSAQENIKKKTVELKVGQAHQISLSTSQSSGYTWNVLNTFDSTVIQLVSRSFEADQDTTLPGKPGKAIFTFKALKKGETTARLVYRKDYQRKISEIEDIVFIISK